MTSRMMSSEPPCYDRVIVMTSLESPCHNDAGRDVSSESARLRASEESLPVMTSQMMSSEPPWSRLTSQYGHRDVIGESPTDRTLWRTIVVTLRSPMTLIPGSWCQWRRRHKASARLRRRLYLRYLDLRCRSPVVLHHITLLITSHFAC